MRMALAIVLGIVALGGFFLLVWSSQRKNKKNRDKLLRRLCLDLLEIAVQREEAATVFHRRLPKIQEAHQAFEALLLKDDYFRNSEYQEWLKFSKGIIEKELLDKAILGLPKDEAALAERFRDRVSDAQPEIDKRNEGFIERKRIEYTDLLSSLSKYSLTDDQEKAVLSDEDRTLVVAGAGTGKTTTLLAKAKFLVRSGRAAPDELLVLSFGRDVARELKEELEPLGVKTYTFHSFGRYLMAKAGSERLLVSKLANDDKALAQYIEKLIQEMLADPAEQQLFNFLLYDLVPSKLWIDCHSKEEYWKYIRSHEPRALYKGQKLRSFEEVRIANFLFSQGIKYEYERKYEHKTTAPGRRQYKPDFYLPDYGIYIEHFGVDRNGNPGFLHGNEAEKYKEEMVWKRNLHQKYGTTLVESYSWEVREGVLEKNLAKHLAELGVKFSPRSRSEMIREFNESGHVSRLARLLATFLNLYKEGDRSLDKLTNTPVMQDNRTRAFLGVFRKIYLAYEEELRSQNEIDFHDMIQKGKRILDSKKILLNYRYILVDELQDISSAKAHFLRSIMDSAKGSRLFCVGDDWQSIYRFAGSDVTVMTHFKDYFGFHKRITLKETFRFGEHIEKVSSDFVLRNHEQLQKRLVPRAHGPHPAIHLILNANHTTRTSPTQSALGRAIENIAQKTNSKPTKVFILGRYNHTRNGKERIITNIIRKHPSLDIVFKTIHSSKGLEADYVIIDDVTTDKHAKSGYGFPCEIDTDPVIELLLSHKEDHPNAEERRLFYVALTRSRNEVFLISTQDALSDFVREIASDIDLIDKPKEFSLQRCPRCEVGVLEVKAGRYGHYKECNLCGYRPGRRAK